MISNFPTVANFNWFISSELPVLPNHCCLLLILFSHFLVECNNDDVVGIDNEMAPENLVDGTEGHAFFGVGPAVGDAPILQLQGTKISIANPEVVTNLIEKHHDSGNHVVPPSIDHQLSSIGIMNPIHAADAELNMQTNCTKLQLCPTLPPISAQQCLQLYCTKQSCICCNGRTIN